MAKKKKPESKTYYEIMQSFRNDWGNVNPVTRIHKDKSKYNRKEKYKKNYLDET
jgi:hypothetical protein